MTESFTPRIGFCSGRPSGRFLHLSVLRRHPERSQGSLFLLGFLSNATSHVNLRVPHPSRLLRRVGSDDRKAGLFFSWVDLCFVFCRDRLLRRSALVFYLCHHPDRSGPAFSRAPFSGAPGRAVEGSWQPINPTPAVATSNLAITIPNLQLSTLYLEPFSSFSLSVSSVVIFPLIFQLSTLNFQLPLQG